MTENEAIQFLDNIKHAEVGRAIGKDGFYAELMGYHVEALNMAIKALETIPKYKDAYGKGWDDGAKASYEHLKMCEEEQSGDLISRDELLKAIDTWDKFGCDADTKLVPYQDHYIPYIHYDDVIKCIKGMPSVNPQEPKWIPVSERLPEDGQNVLFCDIDNDIMVGYHVKGRPDTHFSQDGTYEDMKNVRAWMPLPKPYEPQESEDEE